MNHTPHYTAPAPKICVVGVGFVGEHLASVFARKFAVTGVDISPARIAHLTNTYPDNPRLRFTTDAADASACDLYCIAVPTPIRQAGQDGRDTTTIDLSYLKTAIATVADLAEPGAAIVIESSVAVGTTRQLLGPLREQGLFIGFSPERVDPGRTDPPAHAVPKVLAALDGASMKQIQTLYEAVFDTVVPVSTLETAEMSKLYENCFRLINIAYTNEIADACEAQGIDPHEMVAACATKPYGYMPFTPGLGAGGPCIPVNPHYLLVNNELPLLKAAMEANTVRPANAAAGLVKKHPSAARILVSGIGFKPGQALTIHSPGLELARGLHALGKAIAVHDPLAAEGKATVDGLPVLPCNAWDPDNLSTRFDLVCIAMQQTGVDYSILTGTSAAVEWMCKASDAAKAKALEAKATDIKHGLEQPSALQVHVSALQ